MQFGVKLLKTIRNRYVDVPVLAHYRLQRGKDGIRTGLVAGFEGSLDRHIHVRTHSNDGNIGGPASSVAGRKQCGRGCDHEKKNWRFHNSIPPVPANSVSRL